MSTDDNYKAGSVDNLFNMFKAQKYAEAKASIKKLIPERKIVEQDRTKSLQQNIDHARGYNHAIDDILDAFEDRYKNAL